MADEKNIFYKGEGEELQALYKRLIEFKGDGVYIYTFDEGTILFANQGLVDILDLDCKPEDLIGKSLKDLLIYVEEPGEVRRKIEEKGGIQDYEYHFKTLKGDDRWVIHDSVIRIDPKTEEKIVEAIVKDITERKIVLQQLVMFQKHLKEMVGERTEELKESNKYLRMEVKKCIHTENILRATKSRLEHLITYSPAIIYSANPKDVSYEIYYISDNVKGFLGYDPKEIVDDREFWKKHLHLDDSVWVFSEYRKLYKEGELVTKYRLKCKDGEYKWVRDEMRLVTDEKGGPLEIVGCWADITTRGNEDKR